MNYTTSEKTDVDLEPPERRPPTNSLRYQLLKEGVDAIPEFCRTLSLEERAAFTNALERVNSSSRNGELKYFEELGDSSRRMYLGLQSAFTQIFVNRLGDRYVDLDSEERNLLDIEFQRVFAFWYQKIYVRS